ncbi:Urea transporter 1-like 2 [Homarus americanus]|uniref:Urea transporter 1-like 2 n=1 Tax=Homarus americanus TaxID=6706 RepID=A0A8J5MNZ8_HOMAM|nr:Urea transporter 1-like 2 [Homarus americanus]
MNFVQNPPGVWAWIVGDAPAVRDTLAKFRWESPAVVLKIVESVLRGIAQVVFVNNPLSGLLILIGLFLSDVSCGLGAVVCSLVAVFVAKLLNMPEPNIEAGLTNFSAVLVGTVTPALYPIFFHQPLSPPVWGYMVVAAAFSVCLSGGLGKILGVHNIPSYTLPFNVANAMIFIGMRAAGYGTLVWLGTLLSAGQVWAVENVCCSVLVVVASFICSPLLTLVTYTGGAIATFTALLVSSAPYELVYAGVWGYNGFLSAGSIAFFMVITPRTLLLALINVVFTTFLQATLAPVFSLTQLPVFTMPFVLSSIIFLALATSLGPTSLRVASPSFPEQHLMLYVQRPTIDDEARGKDTYEGTEMPIV